MMKVRAADWSKLWQRDEHLAAQTLATLQDLRWEAGQRKWPTITLDDLDTALASFNAGTAMSLDGFRPAHLQMLPMEGRRALLRLMNSWLASAAFPWQLLIVLVAPSAKPVAGERPIALEQLVVRIFKRFFRGYGQAWCHKYHGHWDDAVSGSSALRAALLRNICDEVDAANGLMVAEGLFDLHTHYDTIAATVSAKEARSRHFHPVPL